MNVNTKILAFIVIMIGFLYSNPIATIAVLELEAQGISKSEAAILTDRLRSTLIKVGQYTVVDRGNMEEILVEQGFQQTGCTSDECVVEVGKLLGVQFMVSGSLGRFGKVYTIQLQILNVETGVIEHSSDYDYEGEIENLLKEGIQTALLRLLGLEDSPTVFSATSIGEPGVLIVSSDPSDAIVKMDGYEIGATPLTNTGVMPGTHIITVKKDGYDETVMTIVIGSGKTVRESFELIRSKGRLQFTVSPSESTVEVDGVKYSTDEVKMLDIPTGDHFIKVTAPYYYPYTTEINLQKDTSMPLAVNLKSGKEEFERLQKRKRRSRTLTAASIVTTLASALLAESLYTKYNDATSPNDAQSYQTTTETIDTITIGLSAISIGVSAYTYLTHIKENKLKMTLGVE